MWYDEPALLAGAEAKLQGKVPTMDPGTCALPENLKDVQFGDDQKEGKERDAAAADRLGRIAEDVEFLRGLEVKCQQTYFALRELAAADMDTSD